MPKNVQTTAQFFSFHMLARLCSNSFKLGFSSTWMRIPRLSSWVWTNTMWLSGLLRPCLYSSSVRSCHLFLISSVSGRSSPFLSFMLILAWNVPLRAQIFLKRSLVFPILFVSSISLHSSLKKNFFCLLVILWNSTSSWVYLSLSPLPFASLFFFSYLQRLLRQPFCLLVFLFLWNVLVTDSWGMLWTSVQSSSLTLSDLILWIYLSLPLHNLKEFYLGHTRMA